MVDHSAAIAFSDRYLQNLSHTLERTPLDSLAQLLGLLERGIRQQSHIFVAGNGGSAATASHMASDLVKGLATRRGIGARAIALSDNVPLITAIANDESYAEVFAGQLSALAQPGDLLLVISGSGNSQNIVRAVEVAQQMGLTTVGLLGKGGGKVGGMVDVAVVVPSNDYGPIEAIHLALSHLLTDYLCQVKVP